MKKMLAFIATQRGFTLLELLATVAIMAVLVVIAVPSYNGTVRRDRLTAQINGFVATLRLAQSEAIKRGKTVTVCKSNNPEASATPACDNSTNWENGWVMFVDDNGNNTIDAGESIIRVGGPLMQGSSLRGSSAVANGVSYLATSEIAAAGTFVLCDNKEMSGAVRSISLLVRRAASAPTMIFIMPAPSFSAPPGAFTWPGAIAVVLQWMTPVPP
jgi:type IV fimbrial biogenesis protein FimT